MASECPSGLRRPTADADYSTIHLTILQSYELGSKDKSYDRQSASTDANRSQLAVRLDQKAGKSSQAPHPSPQDKPTQRQVCAYSARLSIPAPTEAGGKCMANLVLARLRSLLCLLLLASPRRPAAPRDPHHNSPAPTQPTTAPITFLRYVRGALPAVARRSA